MPGFCASAPPPPTFGDCTAWFSSLEVCSGRHCGRRSVAAGSGHFSRLCRECGEQLQRSPAEDFIIKHVPSHLAGSRCESPFEEWIAEHNQHADRVAVMANQNRPEALAQAHARAFVTIVIRLPSYALFDPFCLPSRRRTQAERVKSRSPMKAFLDPVRWFGTPPRWLTRCPSGGHFRSPISLLACPGLSSQLCGT